MFKYVFQVMAADGMGADELSIKADDRDEAELVASDRARRRCKRNGWEFGSMVFLYME